MLPDFNLHTHTFRCHHAQGEDEDYVIKAIENGYKTIGFSDHAPYIFPAGHYSGFRIDIEDAQDYADSIKALKNKYDGVIDIKLGYEVEWYPMLIGRELDYLKSFDYDYLICGQHYTGNEIESWANYTGHKTNNPEDLDRYIFQVLDAASSGEMAYIAHPDIINFKGDKGFFLDRLFFLVRELRRIDIPLEYNFLGYTDRRQYPSDDFWRMVASEGNRVVIGLDAHKPEVYEDKKHLEKMIAHMAELGLKYITDVNEILK